MSSSPDSSQSKIPAINAAATTSVHHAQISDFGTYNRFYRGGSRSGIRSTPQAEQMLHKVPPSHRSGATSAEAVKNTDLYIGDKDASHVISHKNGGSGDPQNMVWESSKANRARGGENMSIADREFRGEMALRQLAGGAPSRITGGSKRRDRGGSYGGSLFDDDPMLTGDAGRNFYSRSCPRNPERYNLGGSYGWSYGVRNYHDRCGLSSCCSSLNSGFSPLANSRSRGNGV